MNVTLEVERANGDTTSESMIKWLLNNEIAPHNYASFTYTINGPLSLADEGVYEAYYDGQRNDAKHAIIRLIVRGEIVPFRKRKVRPGGNIMFAPPFYNALYKIHNRLRYTDPSSF